MSESGLQRLSYREAARMLYGSADPTEVELSKVDYKVARGILAGNRKGQWVNADAVAAYLAARTEQRRLRHADPSGRGATRTGAGAAPGRAAVLAAVQGGGKVLPPIYRVGLRDYFAAVLRQRRPAHASSGFDRAVLAGQVVLVLSTVAAAVGIYATAAGPPPERAAVLASLDRAVEEGQMDHYQVVEWFPPERRGDGALVRVKYRYTKGGNKPIVTDRTYRVSGETVTRVDGD